MDDNMSNEIMSKFAFTGNLENEIKDGIRNEWYAKFYLKNPALSRDMQFTGGECVLCIQHRSRTIGIYQEDGSSCCMDSFTLIERPELQDVC